MESHDSLPYIDADISETQREGANRLIRRELAKDHSAAVHPSLAEEPSSRLSAALQAELNRAGAGQALTNGIDLSRYESFDEISAESDVEIMKSALQTAYANITYLRDRQMNISLLEEYGKNAWLVSNSQLEDVQKRLDAELAETKEQSENTNRMRKAAQENSRGELLGLEDTWKQGIGRIIETQLATDQLKQDLIQKQSQLAR